MENFSVDAYSPSEIAKRVEAVAVSKSTSDPIRVFVLALLAGVFIAFGAAFYTIVTHDPDSLNQGMMRLAGGIAFSLGLILVVVAGAELFTGNNLLVIAYVDKKITLLQLIKNWGIVYLGNLIGAVMVALLIYFSGHWSINNGAVATKVVLIATGKVNLEFIQAFVLGILCNILVCLAVWLCFAGRTVTDKILAILFPITAFVALGFEHSVANMYFIPAGILVSNDPSLVEMVKIINPGIEYSNLTLGHFLINNLLPVTLGNITGGSLFVGIIYWFIYLRK